VLGGFLQVDDYSLPSGPLTVVDGGRVVFGFESFRVRTHGGRPLVIVVRSHPTVEARALRAGGGAVARLEIPTETVRVDVAGREVLSAEMPNRPGWNEHVLRLPAGVVSEGTTSLRLSGRYSAFQYWFYQPR